MPVKWKTLKNGLIPRNVQSLRLSQEERENMNRQFISNETESVIKKDSQPTKVKDQVTSQLNVTKHLEKS